MLTRRILIVRQRVQRLRHRKRPRRSIPCALIAALKSKPRTTSFGGCSSVLTVETLRIEQLFPRPAVRRLRRAIPPRNITNLLAHSRQLHDGPRINEPLLRTYPRILRRRNHLVELV